MGGKKRHSKDRLYLTTWEHKHEWGGYKGAEMRPLSRQPLNCCALSQQPFENPVCSKHGDIFETLNIVPFLKYYKKNPCTGVDMKRDELVKQKFEKDPTDIYSYICPVSKKVLTDNMKICAIRTTGNVYSGTVIDELCKKQKYWRDLLTDEPFKGPNDIITLQEPLNGDARRLVTNFWYIKNKVELDLKKLKGEEVDKAVIEHTGLGKRIMEQVQVAGEKRLKEDIEKKLQKKIEFDPNKMISVKDFIKERKEQSDWKHKNQTTGKVATGVTSTVMDAVTSEQTRVLTDAEMYDHVFYEIKSKAMKTYIQIDTNKGVLNAELFSHRACRTVYSFLDLIYEKKFDNLAFHRQYPEVMISLGENQALTRNTMLDSIDKAEKLVHDRPGLLTISLEGTLGSFGITLGDAGSLDDRNSVFGEVVGNTAVLHEVWDWKVQSANNRPDHLLRIQEIRVLVDPYKEQCHIVRKKLLGYDKIEENIKKEKEKMYHNPLLAEILDS